MRVPFKYVQEIDGKEQIVEAQKMLDGISTYSYFPILYTAFIYYLLKRKIKHILFSYNNYINCICCNIFQNITIVGDIIAKKFKI